MQGTKQDRKEHFMIRLFEYITQHQEQVDAFLRAALLLAVILAMYALAFAYIARTAMDWMKAAAEYRETVDTTEKKNAQKDRDRLTNMSCQAAIAAEKEVARRV